MTTLNQNPPAPDESDKVAARIKEALSINPGVVLHSTARLIAAALHPGAGSALQHFAATGQFDTDVLIRETLALTPPPTQRAWQRALLTFLTAVQRRTHPWTRSAIPQPFARRGAEQALPGDALAETRFAGKRDVPRVKLGGNEEAAIHNSVDSPSIAADRVTRIDQSLVLTIPEAADRLRVSMWTVYRLIREGKLQTLQIGTRRLIPLFAIHRFLHAEINEKDDRHG